MKNKKIDPVMFAIVGFLAMIFFGLACLGLNNLLYIKICIILFIISVILMVCGGIGMAMENKNDKDKIIENENEFQREYDDFVDKQRIIKNKTQATLIELNKYGIESRIPQYLWIENEVLKMFPLSSYYKQNYTSSVHKANIADLKVRAIPIKSILYFEEIGELRQYTSISGGGTSLKGALLGFIIADDVGAIIGSRQPIKTEVKSNDDRRIELIYKSQLGEIDNLEFSHDAYKVLQQLIPSKELRRIKGLKESDNINGNVKKQGAQVRDKLIQLQSLQKEGLITEEEYLLKKVEVLESL